jgi:hypothetical protein
LRVLQRPDVKIHVLKGKELSKEINDIAKRQGINLSLADIKRTKEILEKLPLSLSDEIVNFRESNDSLD